MQKVVGSNPISRFAEACSTHDGLTFQQGRRPLGVKQRRVKGRTRMGGSIRLVRQVVSAISTRALCQPQSSPQSGWTGR